MSLHSCKEAFGREETFSFLGILGWESKLLMFGIHFKKLTFLEKDVPTNVF